MVEEIPNSRDTVCYLSENNVTFATLQYTDVNAIGSKRDTLKATSDGTGVITYTENLGKAVVSYDSGVEGTTAENRVNLSTKWSINCEDVRNLETNEIDSTQTCPEDFTDAEVYIHLVMSEDASSELKTAYGMWASADTFQACGSTEGLNDLPDGWTLDSTVSGDQGNAFSWSTPFDSFSASSTSNEILAMIRNVDSGPSQTYAEYAASESDDTCPNDDMCASSYYENVLRPYTQSGVATCWPEVKFTYTPVSQVEASAWPGMGGNTTPLGRHAFMESSQNGNETYMSSFESSIMNAVDGDDTVECNLKSEFLVALDTQSVISPGTNPLSIVVGTDPSGLIPSPNISTNVRFISNVIVTSVDGTEAHTDLCQSQLGEFNEKTRNGYFSKVEMTSEVNPIPAP